MGRDADFRPGTVDGMDTQAAWLDEPFLGRYQRADLSLAHPLQPADRGRRRGLSALLPDDLGHRGEWRQLEADPRPRDDAYLDRAGLDRRRQMVFGRDRGLLPGAASLARGADADRGLSRRPQRHGEPLLHRRDAFDA